MTREWHFPEATLQFLEGLRADNTRAWFAANKAAHESAYKAPAAAFAEIMRGELARLAGRPHDARIFRIHRDVRFSRDKTPYKTHLHMAFIPQGCALADGAWYFGLEPDSLVVGAGVMGFDGEGLETFRRRVTSVDGEGLANLLDRFAAAGIRLGPPELKRVPRSYPADHARAELLKRKRLAAWIDLPDPAIACRPGLVAACMEGFGRLKPLVEWLAPSG